jgi:hypothetical protein
MGPIFPISVPQREVGFGMVSVYDGIGYRATLEQGIPDPSDVVKAN